MKRGRWLGVLLSGLGAAVTRADPPVPLPAPPATLERELAGGQAHVYAFSRSATEDLWLAVVQLGIDLTLTVRSADGEALLSVDSLSGAWGEESLGFQAQGGARYQFEIRAREPTAVAGRYRLQVQTRSGHPDPRRLAAEQAITAAGRLVFTGTREARQEAVTHFEAALTWWQALGDNPHAASALFNLAMLRGYLGDLPTALTLHRRALGGWQEVGDLAGEAQAWMEIGAVAWAMGESEHAPEAFREALTRWRALGDRDAQARTLNYLGLTAARQVPREALVPYTEALALFRATGNQRQQGVVLNNLGGVYDLLGEPEQAREHFQQALELHRAQGDREQEAAVWNNLASLARRSGRLQDALEQFARALAIRRELGDRRNEGVVRNNLGVTYLRIGDPARARAELEQALLARRSSDDRRGEAVTLHNLGLVALAVAEPAAAVEFFDQALTLRRSTGDRLGEAATLGELGRAAAELGRPEQARQHLEAALAILDQVGNPWRRGRMLTALAQVLATGGAPSQAVQALEQALELLRPSGDQLALSEALLALAQAERGLARAQADAPALRLRAALGHATAALNRLETARADLRSFDDRTTLLAHIGSAFELAFDLAMDLAPEDPKAGLAATALELSEQARARSLLDLLEPTGAAVRGLDPALLERQRQLLDRLNAKVVRQRELRESVGPEALSERLAQELPEIQAELAAVDREIRRQNPRWHALVRPQPFAASALQTLLDPQTLLLEFALGEERSFLWAVNQRQILSFVLPKRAVIEALAQEVNTSFKIHDLRTSAAEAQTAARLSEMLLGPLADQLVAQRLAIVADGALHYLSFAALPHPAAPDEPLLGRHEIVLLPSASVLGVQRQIHGARAPAGAIAVLADPVFGPPDPRLPGVNPSLPLPGAASPDDRQRDSPLERLSWSRVEAEAIATQAGRGRTFLALDFAANRELALGLRGYRIIHFATHGVIDSEHPELSALVLSRYDQDGHPRPGLLRLPEIYHLDWDAELVVLSGCRTALGQTVRGEGMVGLTRGFFVAGASHLVASLWRVQDRATAELMDRFYRHLLADPVGQSLRPAAALRAAQLELRSEPLWRDPYFWAAFVAIGDWR